MQKAILIHNPRCSKSRGAKEILEEKGIEFDTVDYLKVGLSEELLKQLPKLLGLTYKDMIRTKEEAYKEFADKKLSDKEWIEVLKEHPILLERPIFINHDKAIIGRPSELVTTIL